MAEAFSRTWYQREQALLAVHNKLLEATSTSSKEELRNMIRAAGLLTRRALLDKVTLVRVCGWIHVTGSSEPLLGV